MSRPVRRRLLVVFALSFGLILIAVGVTAVRDDERTVSTSKTGTGAGIGQLLFADENGRQLTVADFRDKALLINLWATWCVPCREEMPTLDRLQATLGGPDFEVLTVSLDRGGAEAVRKFFEEIGVSNLAIYLAELDNAQQSTGLVGLPTTLLVDRGGNEVSRVVGPAEWDSPERVATIREALSLSASNISQLESDGDPE